MVITAGAPSNRATRREFNQGKTKKKDSLFDMYKSYKHKHTHTPNAHTQTRVGNANATVSRLLINMSVPEEPERPRRRPAHTGFHFQSLSLPGLSSVHPETRVGVGVGVGGLSEPVD